MNQIFIYLIAAVISIVVAHKWWQLSDKKVIESFFVGLSGFSATLLLAHFMSPV